MKEFQAILQQHKVDDTFEARVIEQMARNRKQPDSNAAVFEPPSWCKLCVAKQVPLYELFAQFDDDHRHRNQVVLAASISPSENSIAVLTQRRRDCLVDVWDLSTKEHAHNRLPSLSIDTTTVIMPADDRLATSIGTMVIRVWSNQDNGWSNTITHEDRQSLNGGFEAAFLRNQNELLFTVRHRIPAMGEGAFDIWSLNTLNGGARSIFHLNARFKFATVFHAHLALCYNKWLLVFAHGRQGTKYTGGKFYISGIYVCDLAESKPYQEKFFEGNFDRQGMIQSSVGSPTVYCMKRRRVCILDLDDTGRLSKRPLSFSIPGYSITGLCRNRLVIDHNRNKERCSVYDSEMGEPIRLWRRQYQKAVVARPKRGAFHIAVRRQDHCHSIIPG